VALTPQDVRDKQFTPTRFKTGYDEDEVDAFLDVVESELTTLLDRIQSLESDLGGTGGPRGSIEAADPVAKELPAASATQLEMEEMLGRALLVAQRTADEALRDARTEADRLLAEARDRAGTEEREAAERITAALQAGELDRQRLETRVEQLKSFEEEHRARLRAYLQMQLRDLDERAVPDATGGREPAPAPQVSVDLMPLDNPSAAAAAAAAAAPVPVTEPLADPT
jgi:DivIVA domain-containing protein